MLCCFWSQPAPVCVLGPAELGICFSDRTTWPRSLQDLSPPRSDMLVMNTQTQQRMTHMVQLPAGLPHPEGIVCSLGPGRSQLLPLLLHQHLVVSLQCSTPARLPSNPSQGSWDRSGFACCCQSLQRKASIQLRRICLRKLQCKPSSQKPEHSTTCVPHWSGAGHAGLTASSGH